MKDFITALRIFAVLTIITGVAYPLAVWGIGQGLFKHQANGSLIERDGKVVGSRLIAQSFDDPKYFWSRPSGAGYNAAASSGTNLGPTNPALREAIEGRVKALKDADPANTDPVPTELVTASGSGLDPHISPLAAEYQAGRVARTRNMAEDRVRAMIREHTESPDLGVLGEARVNVLELNLALDAEKAR
jgi:K+-transporting ATPase ATPase C chain